MICIYVCIALHLSCYLQSSSEPDSWRWPTHDHVIQVCWTGTDKARYVYIYVCMYVYIYIRTDMRMLYYQTSSTQEITNIYYTFPHVSYHHAMSNKLSHTVQQKISGKGGQLWKRGPGEELLGLCALERRFVRSLPRGGCERRAQRATWPRWAPLSAGVSQKPWGIFTSSQIGDFWTICLMQLPRIAWKWVPHIHPRFVSSYVNYMSYIRLYKYTKLLAGIIAH